MLYAMQVLRGYNEAARVFANRGELPDAGARDTVLEILGDVRRRGDAAVRDYTERFDGARLGALRVSEADFDRAEDAVPDDLKAAIILSIGRVRDFYCRQPQGGFTWETGGGTLSQLVKPLRRVGVYAPGGSAPLFSTLLMCAVPAQVAGVPEIVVATPPRPDGSVAPEILVTARLLGLQEVYRVGGAQAIGALAYGTETLPRVDKIVGPGNRFVVLAKQLVFGAVGIEALPGPTETLVLADASADPKHVAADLLAQAEHVYAQPVLVTTDEELLARVRAELSRQLETLPTQAAAAEALERRGYAVIVSSLKEGLRVSNLYAPEHLCLLVQNPEAALEGVEHAGGVFVGASSMEALGDYAAGPSHVMPTGGTARFASALNVRDFQKVIPVVNLGPETLAEIGPSAARLARAEGLEAHARAIESRLGEHE